MADVLSIAQAPPTDDRRYDPLAQLSRSRREELLTWLAAQPLVPPTIGLVLGIALDSVSHLPFLLAVLVFILPPVAIIRYRSAGARHVAIALAALAVGSMLHDLSYRRWPP